MFRVNRLPEQINMNFVKPRGKGTVGFNCHGLSLWAWKGGRQKHTSGISAVFTSWNRKNWSELANAWQQQQKTSTATALTGFFFTWLQSAVTSSLYISWDKFHYLGVECVTHCVPYCQQIYFEGLKGESVLLMYNWNILVWIVFVHTKTSSNRIIKE